MPKIEIYLSDTKIADITMDVTSNVQTGEYNVSVVPDYQSTFEIFREQFLHTPGLFGSPLSSGVGSWEELLYVLKQCCKQPSPVTYRVIDAPLIKGSFDFPPGFLV